MPCHDRAGGSRQADLRTRVLRVLVYRSVRPRHRSTPTAPHHRLHATGADRRTSLTSSLYVSPTCGSATRRRRRRPCARTRKVREIEEGLQPTASRVASKTSICQSKQTERQRSAKQQRPTTRLGWRRVAAGESSCLLQPMHRVETLSVSRSDSRDLAGIKS